MLEDPITCINGMNFLYKKKNLCRQFSFQFIVIDSTKLFYTFIYIYIYILFLKITKTRDRTFLLFSLFSIACYVLLFFEAYLKTFQFDFEINLLTLNVICFLDLRNFVVVVVVYTNISIFYNMRLKFRL